jgi:hypothetical protein
MQYEKNGWRQDGGARHLRIAVTHPLAIHGTTHAAHLGLSHQAGRFTPVSSARVVSLLERHVGAPACGVSQQAAFCCGVQ